MLKDYSLCNKSHEQILKWKCEKCKQLVCHKCWDSKHINHITTTSTLESHFANSITEKKDLVIKLEKTLEYADNKMENLRNNIQTKIDDAFQILFQRLQISKKKVQTRIFNSLLFQFPKIQALKDSIMELKNTISTIQKDSLPIKERFEISSKKLTQHQNCLELIDNEDDIYKRIEKIEIELKPECDLLLEPIDIKYLNENVQNKCDHCKKSYQLHESFTTSCNHTFNFLCLHKYISDNHLYAVCPSNDCQHKFTENEIQEILNSYECYSNQKTSLQGNYIFISSMNQRNHLVSTRENSFRSFNSAPLNQQSISKKSESSLHPSNISTDYKDSINLNICCICEEEDKKLVRPLKCGHFICKDCNGHEMPLTCRFCDRKGDHPYYEEDHTKYGVCLRCNQRKEGMTQYCFCDHFFNCYDCIKEKALSEKFEKLKTECLKCGNFLNFYWAEEYCENSKANINFKELNNWMKLTFPKKKKSFCCNFPLIYRGKGPNLFCTYCKKEFPLSSI